MCWLGLALLREDFHRVLALSVPLTLSLLPPAAGVFSIHQPQGFQSSPMPGHFFASFFLAANTPLLPQFFFLLQHIPLFFQSQPALCLLTLSTCSDL